MIWSVIFVAIGGALGAVCRYLASLASVRMLGAGFPYGTLFVNVAGSLMIGIAFVVLMPRGEEPSRWLPLVIPGFLGGFTTFSAFSLDTLKLIEGGRYLSGVLYIGGSVGLSLLAVAFGVMIAKGVLG